MSDDPTPDEQPRWMELGPGPCKNELLRVRNLARGCLVAVVRQNKGYSAKSVNAADPRDEVVVVSEQTLAIVFMPNITVGPVSANEPAPASPQSRSAPSPETDASSPEPVPGTAGADATTTQ